MAYALLLFHIDVEVADHHKAALGANVFLAAAKLARGHVALHDVHAVLLIEGDAGHFVEADDVVLANQSALAVGIVHEHFGHGRLAARNEVGVWRNLLEEVALASPARAKFHQVVVTFHERDYTQ